MADRTPELTLHRITEADAERVAAFLADMPEQDQTFFKEPTDAQAVVRWCNDDTAHRWLALDDRGGATAYLAIIPGVGWSAHVGELRLIVSPAHRRRGIGAALARRGLIEGVGLGLAKLTVEVVADKPGDIEMFTSIGFHAEALLADHFRSKGGVVHDLVILSHMAEEVADALSLVGVDQAVGLGGTR